MSLAMLGVIVKLFGRNIFVYIFRACNSIEQKVGKSNDDYPIAVDKSNFVGYNTLYKG